MVLSTFHSHIKARLPQYNTIGMRMSIKLLIIILVWRTGIRDLGVCHKSSRRTIKNLPPSEQPEQSAQWVGNSTKCTHEYATHHSDQSRFNPHKEEKPDQLSELERATRRTICVETLRKTEKAEFGWWWFRTNTSSWRVIIVSNSNQTKKIYQDQSYHSKDRNNNKW